MYKGRLREPVDGLNLQVGYMEMDPSGRYGRFRDVLGKGAVKTVYKAFDEILGMEVAWNQVKLNDVLQSPDELQRLYSEVHLLNNLDHDSIMRFYTSWIDVDLRTFNFISEMFTSGTLREYRKRVKRVNIHAVKNWSRQILQGLAYLHGNDPPVIHRDLKCDNIFINGHLGQVKIGDLGLATILRHSQHAHSVIGTPEFMAPELYEEDYDELVDIYSFGMCVLEMLTSEYPYSECTNPAQIYKKVTSGKLPDAFYGINDVEAKNFVGKCLQTASKRPSAKELLTDPFLSHDEIEPLPVARFLAEKLSINEEVFKVPPLSCNTGSRKCMNMTITGKMNPEDDTIFLKVQIYDKEGKNRNVYFPFDIVNDTAHDVATEMVRELEITDYEPFEIAKMIDDDVSTFVPSWKESESLPYNRQHSFNYDEDDDDDRTPFSFYSSSHSSSQASLPGHFISRETQIFPKNNVLTSCHDWFQEDLLTDDDTTSQNSLGTYKSSDYHCCSDNEIETQFNSKAQKCTRFCPEERIAKDCKKKQGNQFQNAKEHFSSNDTRRISRIRSLVDIRSQLLHRTLLEEIKKRRMFKTVGAVENIGYHEPVGFSRRSSPKITRMQRFEW